MIRLKDWSRKPSGQVLLATLLFCFIFIALFLGLFKSGLLYSAKERATRASNLTVLAAGAVYANGMQVVRLSNMIVIATALASAALLATGVGELVALGSLFTLDFDPLAFVKAVQKVQDLLFGITTKLPGLYPLLITVETFSIAGQNGLKSTWPGFSPNNWKLPTSLPSPILFFNILSIGPKTTQALIPNMALKFRDGSFLTMLKPKKFYQFTRVTDGKVFTYTEDQVELAPGSRGASYRVKPGLENQYKFVTEIKIPGSEKLAKLANTINALTALKLDVTDRDDPPLHNIFVFGSYPTSIADPSGNKAEIMTLGQVTVSGSGLEAWKVSDPHYSAFLSPTDPIELAKEMGIQSILSQLGNLLNLQNLFKKAIDDLI